MIRLINWFIDFVLHMDKHLGEIIQTYQNGTYIILFLIIFCETGLVVTPILPGDSLLFAAGTFARKGDLNIEILCIILSIAAVAGDTVNYWIGRKLGPKVFSQEKSRFFKKEYLDRTHKFYEKYGPMTIIIARFMPIIRTFAPFVAGIGKMGYAKFITYNIIGGVSWICILLLGGYLFAELPFVRDHFSVVIMAIIFISILPAIIEFLRHRYGKKKESAG